MDAVVVDEEIDLQSTYGRLGLRMKSEYLYYRV